MSTGQQKGPGFVAFLRVDRLGMRVEKLRCRDMRKGPRHWQARGSEEMSRSSLWCVLWYMV